jgi:GTPase
VKRALPAVAIVGRPNVGKSTLFNRVLGQRLAIVEDVPGVTRDRHFAPAEWAGHAFYLVDTGGLETETNDPLLSAVRQQVMVAIEEADVIVHVVDGKTGPHPVDYRIAELLRRAERPVLLVVNKVDRLPDDLAHHEFWGLGLGDPHPVSALSGKGSGDVLDVLVSLLPDAGADAEAEDTLHVAVIGKPNVGKSSFVNKLLGEDRMVVSEVAGTTRDSIDTPLRYHGRTLVFVDTAGLRRQARIDPGLEYYSSLRTARAVERSDVCLLLIDATEPPHVQDLKIAEKAWEQGCGLIIVANKWDLVEKDDKTAPAYERFLKERAPSLRWVPVVFTSAVTGQRVQKVLDLVLTVAAERQRRIATHEVNEVLRALVGRQQPPHVRGHPIKLLYATQADSEPPTFIIFTNFPKAVPEAYVRFLHNGFRDEWGFEGVPLRLRFKGRKEEER